MEAALRWGILAVALLLGGCDQVDSYISQIVKRSENQQIALNDQKLRDLRAQIDSQRGRETDLVARIDNLQKQVNGLEFVQNYLQSALENVNQVSASGSEGEGYGIARTPDGIFLVTMEKLEPYLDGYRLTLRIGNPTTVTFTDASIEVSWGLPWTAKGKSYKEISESQKKKKFSIIKSFAPGSYTAVDVALTPAQADEVKTVSVGVEWNRLSLRRPQN